VDDDIRSPWLTCDDPRDVPAPDGTADKFVPLYVVDGDEEYLVDPFVRCTGNTKQGIRCGNYVFVGRPWTPPADALEREPVTFTTPTAQARALLLRCPAHAKGHP
jgi:hypothetical protein